MNNILPPCTGKRAEGYREEFSQNIRVSRFPVHGGSTLLTRYIPLILLLSITSMVSLTRVRRHRRQVDSSSNVWKFEGIDMVKKYHAWFSKGQRGIESINQSIDLVASRIKLNKKRMRLSLQIQIQTLASNISFLNCIIILSNI